MRLAVRAPGKVNLCLFLGPLRPDGRHELVTLFESVSLADDVSMDVAGVSDSVVCPGVHGPNIVAAALVGLRERGWDAPPVRVVVRKRIPVAGGMGGGSADAAAVLRAAPEFGGVPDGVTEAVAAELGADVPSQLVPGVAIGTGAGDVVARRPALAAHAFVVVPHRFGLSTARVYGEADRLALGRDGAELAARARSLRVAVSEGARLPARLLVNDLEPAALALRPEIGAARSAVREAGAAHAMVSGSGPTVLGVFVGSDAAVLAADAAGRLSGRYPGAISAVPVSEDFGAPRGS